MVGLKFAEREAYRGNVRSAVRPEGDRQEGMRASADHRQAAESGSPRGDGRHFDDIWSRDGRRGTDGSRPKRAYRELVDDLSGAGG